MHKTLDMIPILIMYVLKRSKHGDQFIEKFRTYKGVALRIVCLLLILLVTKVGAENPHNLSENITFNVVKKNKTIGTISISKIQFRDSITYTLKSKIDAKFIVKFNIVGAEKAVYQNGKLVFSSVFRKVNNKVKANHSISLENGSYKLNGSDKNQTLNLADIDQNLITLYLKEPTGLQEIYCDNTKRMGVVTQLGEGRYKVKISRDKYNIFHYKNGRCVKIEAFSSLFDVVLIPQEHV